MTNVRLEKEYASRCTSINYGQKRWPSVRNGTVTTQEDSKRVTTRVSSVRHF